MRSVPGKATEPGGGGEEAPSRTGRTRGGASRSGSGANRESRDSGSETKRPSFRVATAGCVEF